MDNLWDIVSINYNNAIINIYCVILQCDYVGISNHKIRQKQIKILREAMILNREHLKKDLNFNGSNYDIICIQSNIPNFKNNSINKEYDDLLKYLKAIDTYDYVQKIKYGINSQIQSDISYVRRNFILLSQICSEIFDKSSFNYGLISNKSFGIAIRNSIIDDKNCLYNAFPLITEFVMEKNNNEPYNFEIEDTQIIE